MNETKPFWESHGCEAYIVRLSMEGSTKFLKEMVFQDESTMQSSMKLAEAEPIKKLFSQSLRVVFPAACGVKYLCERVCTQEPYCLGTDIPLGLPSEVRKGGI